MTGIYKITNKINNKIYIGKAKNITARWNQHYLDSIRYDENDHMPIHKAIHKYGIEQFTFKILYLCTLEELDAAEEIYINYYDARNTEKGYNIVPGGLGCPRLGEDNGNAKINNKLVYEIREAYNNLEYKQDVYARYQDIIS